MLKARRTGTFKKALKELEEKDPKIISLTEEKIFTFLKNPDDTRIKNHPLKRRMKGKWAFSVTDDIRIVYKKQSKNVVRFLAIGSHKTVYTRLD